MKCKLKKEGRGVGGEGRLKFRIEIKEKRYKKERIEYKR